MKSAFAGKCVSGVVAITLLSGFALSLQAQTNVKEVAVITTDHGEILIEMWPDVAPGTVENFKKLSAANAR